MEEAEAGMVRPLYESAISSFEPPSDVKPPVLTMVRPLYESAITSFGPPSDVKPPVLTPRFRLFFSLSLHLAGFFSKLLLVVAFVVLGQQEFFIVLICLWMVMSIFCTIAIASDESFLKDWPPMIRLPFLFLVFGMLQGAHIKHMIDIYKRRSNLEDGQGVKQMGVSSKTFDEIIEGIPFALLGLCSAFLMDRSLANCPWYLTFERKYESSFSFLTVLFFTCGWVSILTLVFGVMELDYRVSEQVRALLDSSPVLAVSHFLHRCSEVAFQIFTYIIGYMFLRPVLINGLTETSAGVIFYVVPFVVLWLIRVVLLVCVTPRSSQGEHILAHFFVAFAALVVDPGTFVDSPAYVTASRRVTRTLQVLRCVEFVIIAVAVVWAWPQELPTLPTWPNECYYTDGAGAHADDAKVGYHLLKWNRSLFVQWGLSFAAYIAFSGTRALRGGHQSGSTSLSDAMVLEMIPDMTKGDDGMRVRTSARGFSSYLLSVGTGLTSKMFEKEEQQLADFVIERVLGKGSYGVVMLVRLRNAGGGPSQPDAPFYAMKIQNTEGRQSQGGIAKVLPSRDLAATREASILKALKHPFVVQLISFFEVPDKEFRDSSTGEIVTDSSGNKKFHKAIVMEFCPGGDLDHYILSNGLAPGTQLPQGRPLSDQSLNWLVRARRFAAEMCVGIAFLHSKHIIYRDLKPQNVLLKSGFDDEIHICFTDFGFSKKVGGGTASASLRLDSLAGTPLYAAPEIMTIAEKQIRKQYTPSVDLFSLGKTILVTLWRTKMYEQSQDLEMPGPEEYRNDPRVPRSAQQMIDKLISRTPESRGRADQLSHQVFFSEIKMNSQTRPLIPAINWVSLEQDAW